MVAAKAWECPSSLADLSSSGDEAREQKASGLCTTNVRPHGIYSPYSIVSRQGMGREHVTMLLVAELPERENRGVFWGFLFCGRLLDS